MQQHSIEWQENLELFLKKKKDQAAFTRAKGLNVDSICIDLGKAG